MIPIENFKEGVRNFVQSYLDEKRVDNEHEMAGVADDYKCRKHKPGN